MTSVQGRSQSYRKRPSVPLSNFFLSFELDNDLSDQPVEPPGANFPVTVVFATTPTVPKYTKKELQRIFKIVLKAWDKPLKARFLDVYCRKSYMECYNFCQQCENYVSTTEAKGANQILFAVSFFWDRISFYW